MDKYDPLVAPDPETWLGLDEADRIALIEAYHNAAGIVLPNLALHAGIHAAVENQIANGDSLPVTERVRQLMAQGLNRHEVLHAIGSVLTKHLIDVQRDRIRRADANTAYYNALKRLNARKWQRSG